MKKILLFLLLSVSFTAFGQLTDAQVRDTINTKLSNNTSRKITEKTFRDTFLTLLNYTNQLATGTPIDLGGLAPKDTLSYYARLSNLAPYAGKDTLTYFARLANLSALAGKDTLANFAQVSQLANYATTANLNSTNTTVAGKVDKVAGKGLSTNDLTAGLFVKLNGIATGATANDTDVNLRTRGTHTGVQDATTITESSTKRFVTDTEKTTWNGKQAALGFTPANAATVTTQLAAKSDTATVGNLSRTRTPYTTTTGLRAGAVGNAITVILSDTWGYTFQYDPNDSTTPDDSVMTIRFGNRRYKRITDRIKPEFWGGNPFDAISDKVAIQKAFDFGAKQVYFSYGTWLAYGIDTKNSDIQGSSSGNTFIKCNGGTEIFILGYDGPHWRRRIIENIALDGNLKSYNGLTFKALVSTEVSGRWTVKNVSFKNFNKAIEKTNGNIGNYFEHCVFQGNDFGYYAVGTVSPYMHAGFDTFYECTWETTALAGIYINSPVGGTGGTMVIRGHFESNPGFCVFVKDYTQTVFSPIQFDQFWGEINATAASVTIDGVAYTPKEIYLNNCGNFTFTNSAVGSIQVINSSGNFDNTRFNANGSNSQDSLSVVTVSNIVADGIKMPFLTNSIRKIDRTLGSIGGIVLNSPHRQKLAKNQNKIYEQGFQNSITIGGSVGMVGVKMKGGPTLDSCNRYTLTPGQTNITPTVNITAGKYYVATVAIRQVSDQRPQFIQIGYGTVMANHHEELLVKGKWKTLATVGKAIETNNVALYFASSGQAANAVFDLQAFQIVEFNTEAEAIEYYRQAIY